MKWFYIDENITDGERRQGPYSIEDIEGFVKEGKITETTLVWHSGEPAWKPWKEYATANEGDKCEVDQDQLLQETINEILKEQVLAKRYAGFFVRALAFIIDNFILMIAGIIVLAILGGAGLLDLQQASNLAGAYLQDLSSTEALNKLFNAPGMSLFLSIWSALQAIYFIVMHARFGATVGKKIFHIHVETGAGNKISWIGAILRYIASLLTQLTLMFYGLGYLIVFIDPKRRTVHDFIANTRVVYDAPKTIKISEN